MAVSLHYCATRATTRATLAPTTSRGFFGGVARVMSHPHCQRTKRAVSVYASHLTNPYDTLEQVTCDLASFPACKFFKIEAIVRPWRLSKLVQVLNEKGIRGMTVSDVRGIGVQGGLATERDGGTEYSAGDLVEKVRVQIVLSRSQVDTVVRIICTSCYTGEVGDGKIFVYPVADVVRIRTGETGAVAEKMSGGMEDLTSASEQ